MANRTIVGSFYWTTGPLVIAPEKARKLVQADRDKPTLTQLARAKKPLTTVGVAGADALVFPDRLPSTWIALGKEAGVLARVAGHTMKAPEVLSLDPGAVPAERWKSAVATVKLADKAILFDAVSHHPKGPVSDEDATTIALPLGKGTYVVDTATTGERDFAVTLYRFRPASWTPPAAKKTGKQPGPPADLVLRKETIALAKKTKFVSSDEGGSPVIACPVELLPAWTGVDGGDYDRACDTRKHVLRVGTGQALVFETDSIAITQRADGTAYAFIWIGADEGAHVIEAVLSAPAEAWKSTKQTFTASGAGKLVLLDAAKPGRGAKGVTVALKPGRYAIDQMKEYDGVVHAGKRAHDVMASGLRLHPL